MKAGQKAGYASACAGSMFYFTGKKIVWVPCVRLLFGVVHPSQQGNL